MLLVAAVAWLSCCADTSGNDGGGGTPAAAEAAVETAEEWLPRGINQIVWFSDIGVIGTVTATETVAIDNYYLDAVNAVLEVESVLYTNESWVNPAPSVGDQLPFHNYAIADQAGSVGGLPPDVAPTERFGAPMPVGTRVLLMLGGAELPTLGYPSPPHGYQGMWILTPDGRAESVQPERTVELPALLDRIEQERERGLLDPSTDPAAFEADLLTVNNPLGADRDPLHVPPTTFGEGTETTGP